MMWIIWFFKAIHNKYDFKSWYMHPIRKYGGRFLGYFYSQMGFLYPLIGKERVSAWKKWIKWLYIWKLECDVFCQIDEIALWSKKNYKWYNIKRSEL